ncbi:MAG: Wadjet anti-phage system protein JetD domain-containing protein [Polaromonas sp.]
MSWTRPADLRAQLQKMWNRGDWLASQVSGASLFPQRLALKGPTSAEMSERFDEVRSWISQLRAAPGYRITMREFRHRIFGANSVPHEVWVDSLDDALGLIGKRRDAARFAALIEMTRQRQPQLLDWLARRPLRALELADEWSRLLDIVAWLSKHPRPGIYLRQVDIAGVHSKFIEAYRGVLAELADRVLPLEAVDVSASGASQFAQRYGFRDKPLRIRFRLLDPAHSPWAAALGSDPDIALDAASFARLDLNLSRVFITENEINFLAFPQVKGSLVIFGAGYGFDMLANIAWLARCQIHYWGDIDTHGFAILDQLRARFAHVESFLMDRATLLAFEPQWGEEAAQTLRDLPRLKPQEQALYDDLRDNRLRKSLRLEQEKIGFSWVAAQLAPLKTAAS